MGFGVITISIRSDMTYKNSDFEVLGEYGAQYMVMVVKADAPWISLKEIVDYAKKNPGAMKYGTSGIGTSLHFGMELFKIANGGLKIDPADLIASLAQKYPGFSASSQRQIVILSNGVMNGFDAKISAGDEVSILTPNWGDKGRKMPKKLTYQDMMDLIAGAVVLGCGGGGDPAMAKVMVDEVFEKGREFTLLDPRELPEGGWSCILGNVGGGIEPKEREMVRDLKRVWPYPIFIAAQELSKYLGIEIASYLPTEIGAGNTVTALYVAAMEGKAVIDGDAAGGRAKPELIISTTNLKGIPVTPLSMATHFGDVLIMKESLSDDRAENICRYISRVSAGRVAVARCPAKSKDLLPAVYPNSISLAIQVGKTIREEKKNAAESVMGVLGGSKRFAGSVESFTREEKDGFMWGDILLKGLEEFFGQEFKIWFKNENLIAWRNGQVDITCPDGIVIVDARNGAGLYNWGDHFHKGRKVVVIGVPAAPMWKTSKGEEIFGPRHFGFEFGSKTINN